MPIYEYTCPDCGAEFERMRKLSDPPLTDCPDCGGAQVRKLISRTSFMLKGGGWYSDHYGLKGGSEGSGAKSEGAKSAGGGASSGGASAPSGGAASTPATGT